jgi:hypothetical protein
MRVSHRLTNLCVRLRRHRAGAAFVLLPHQVQDLAEANRQSHEYLGWILEESTRLGATCVLVLEQVQPSYMAHCRTPCPFEGRPCPRGPPKSRSSNVTTETLTQHPNLSQDEAPLQRLLAERAQQGSNLAANLRVCNTLRALLSALDVSRVVALPDQGADEQAAGELDSQQSARMPGAQPQQSARMLPAAQQSAHDKSRQGLRPFHASWLVWSGAKYHTCEHRNASALIATSVPSAHSSQFSLSPPPILPLPSPIPHPCVSAET